jgi:excinuclease ABC subunit A
MESLSTFTKRFLTQVTKPDVDFVFGLSPVVSIEQKTLANNPRSTVGTMTDVSSYLNLLFATIGQAHCPRTGEPAPSRTARLRGHPVLARRHRDRAAGPVFKVYGEDLATSSPRFVAGCRRLIVEARLSTCPKETDLNESDVSTSTAS